MAKRHALGRAGRTRGVHQHRRLIGRQAGQLIRLRGQQLGPRAGVASPEVGRHLVVEQDQLGHPTEGRRACRKRRGSYQRAAVAVLEHPVQILLAHLLVQRHRERAAAHDAQQGDYPLRLARREQAHCLAGTYAEAGETRGKTQCVLAQPVARPGSRIRGDNGRSVAVDGQPVDQIRKSVQHAWFSPRPAQTTCLAKVTPPSHP